MIETRTTFVGFLHSLFPTCTRFSRPIPMEKHIRRIELQIAQLEAARERCTRVLKRLTLLSARAVGTLGDREHWSKQSLNIDVLTGLYIIECDAGSDCLFHVVRVAVSLLNRKAQVLLKPVTVTRVRQWAASTLTCETVTAFLEQEQRNHDFKSCHSSMWSPASILSATKSNKERLQKTRESMLTTGSHYPGDDETLRRIAQAGRIRPFGIGFIVLTNFGAVSADVIGNDDPNTKGYVLLYHSQAKSDKSARFSHWQLMAFRDAEDGFGFFVVPEKLHPESPVAQILAKHLGSSYMCDRIRTVIHESFVFLFCLGSFCARNQVLFHLCNHHWHEVRRCEILRVLSATKPMKQEGEHIGTHCICW